MEDLFKKKKEEGTCFSTTTDEWTDLAVRRFACVNVHFPGGEPKTIGMVRCEDTLDAAKAAEVLTEKLDQFGLSVAEDIACVTNDGARYVINQKTNSNLSFFTYIFHNNVLFFSVMTAMGKLLPCDQQLCHAHGLHLAVCDCLYEKKARKTTTAEAGNLYE